MRTLSFAWTTPAVLAAHFQPGLTCKTRTRRDWAPKTVKGWALALGGSANGVLASAWDKSARFGGKQFGTVLVTQIALDESTGFCAAEPRNWKLEGFDMLQAIGQEFQKGYTAIHVWRYWCSVGPGENKVTVIDFKLVEVNEYGRQLWRELEDRHGENLRRRLSLEEAMRG